MLGPVLAIPRSWAVLFVVGAAACSRPAAPAPTCELGEGRRCEHRDLSHMSFAGANLKRAHLAGSFLVGADLSGADLSGADLRGADLSATRLVGARFVGADLSRVALTAVRGRNADFQSAILDGVSIDGDFTGANFRGARVTEALSGNCLGNSPTTVKGQPHQPARVRCRLQKIEGRGMTCPDGTVEPDRGIESQQSCRDHLAPSP
jgi:uncharacterized protein YjbI with pentapeptide repeats